MKHFVYRTTNLVNSKYYIGVHSCNCNPCYYLGSGVTLKKAIKKYGRHNFKREILKEFSSREEAGFYEKYLLSNEVLLDPLNYNLKEGGNLRGGSEKPCFVNQKYFPSRAKAAEHFKVRRSTITKWINENCSESFVVKKPSCIKGKNFTSHSEAARHFKVSKSTISNWVLRSI